jgi:hypothetical protein
MKLDRKRSYAWIKTGWLLAVLIGGVYYVVKNYVAAVDYLQTIGLPRLVLCLLFILGMRLLHPHLVQRSLALAGWELPFPLVFSIVSISQLGKYLPGGVWQFVARFAAYRQNRLSYRDMGKAFVVENVWLILGSLFVGAAAVFLGRPPALMQLFGAAFGPGLLPALAGLSLLLWALTIGASEYAIRSAGRRPSAAAACAQFISQTGMWLLLGLSFACLIQVAADARMWGLLSGAFILSFLAGYVAIFAPGGIGVREYVAVLLLSSLFSGPEIGVAAIVHRLLYTLAELLLAGVSLWYDQRERLPAT